MLKFDSEQRHEREDAPLTIVVDAHDKRNIFDRCYNNEGPDDERKSSEYNRWISVRAGEGQKEPTLV